jgi:hypothetical protein
MAIQLIVSAVPTGSLRSAQFAVYPGSLPVRLWQRPRSFEAMLTNQIEFLSHWD